MILTPQYSDENRACFIKESKYFSCKKKCHAIYDCPKKKEVATISEGANKDSNN